MSVTDKELTKMRRELIAHFNTWDKETLAECMVACMSDEDIIIKAKLERKRQKMPNYAYKIK